MPARGDWLAHEANLPRLRVRRAWPDERIEAYVTARQKSLALGRSSD